jgi:hypothetical protein
MANDAQISTTVTKDLDWARHHLFLLVAVVILAIGSIYAIESLLANRTHENFLQTQAILQQFQEQNKVVQAQTQAEIATLTQQNTILQQQVGTLAAAISTRDAQLSKDKEQIKTLPPPQLAAKWGSSANESAPTLDSSGNFIAPLPLAQKSVDALITVPVLQQDKKDLQSQLAAETTVATNNDTKFQDEKKAHQSDQQVCTQAIAAKDAEIKDIKAQNRKRNIILTVLGIALGFGLRH